MSHQSFSRRQALKGLLLGAGAASLPAWALALSEKALTVSHHHHSAAGPAQDPGEWSPQFLTAHQSDTVEVLSDLIIPETETPGAKAAGVNRFIDRVLYESDPLPQREFVRGLTWLDQRSRELFGSDFGESQPDQRVALLTILSSPANRSLDDQPGVEFFRAIKSLTVTGYYTSEIGIYEELGEGELFFEGYDGCTHPEHQRS